MPHKRDFFVLVDGRHRDPQVKDFEPAKVLEIEFYTGDIAPCASDILPEFIEVGNVLLELGGVSVNGKKIVVQWLGPAGILGFFARNIQ